MKRVYITDKHLVGHSMHHTVYAGDPTSPKNGSGHHTAIIRQEFFNGVAFNVDDTTYRILHDLGHVDTAKPVKPEDVD